MMRSFGTLEDGRSIEAITLGHEDGLQVEVLTYGAILRRLSYPVRGVRRDLILNFDRLEHYERDRAYVGSLVGRFGNRIAGSRFDLDGRTHQVTANEGVNHLHGGALGFGKRVWRVLDITESEAPRVILGYLSPDGEEGYPGNVEATAELVVKRDALSIILSARSDAATPINLTYHPYFNLQADRNLPATEQRLRIPASHYLPVGPGLIPTGRTRPGRRNHIRLSREPPIAPAGRDRTSAARARRRLRPLLGAGGERGLRLRAFLAGRRHHVDDVGRPGAAVLQRPVPVAQPSADRQRRDSRTAGISECAQRTALSAGNPASRGGVSRRHRIPAGGVMSDVRFGGGPAPPRSYCGRRRRFRSTACMQDPVERAGSSGACEDVARSYAALRAASMSGNGTSQEYFLQPSVPD